MHKPIIPYMGGKTKLAKEIIPLINGAQAKTYVEPFCGGAAIFFLKKPSEVEIINDINGDLVNLYRVVKYHLEEFIRHFKWALISREEFLNLKNIDPKYLTDIQKAARFYYLQKNGFGGKVDNHTFGYSIASPPRFNLLRIEEDLSQAHIRLARTLIENISWEKCLETYDSADTLFYLDPPYWGLTGYGVDFPFNNYEKMKYFADNNQGKVIISINDHPDIRKVFAGLHFMEVNIKYTVGTAKSDRNMSNELIISNCPFSSLRSNPLLF